MKTDIILIKGDGIGRTINGVPGISDLMINVLEAAVQKHHPGHTLNWMPALAGDEARETNFPNLSDEELSRMSEKEQQEVYLPQKTLDEIKRVGLAIKGPLTTPVGGGFRSINVGLRQIFDLYACVRPVKYIPGVPAPNKNADQVDMVVFRENVEDIYAGIEYEAGSEDAKSIANYYTPPLREGWSYGIGIKPVSEQGSKRLIKRAIEYAIDHGYKTVTLMHKGNIMKFTEGAFSRWGYEVAENYEGRVEVNDRIADSMFQQIQLRPAEYGVIATTNLNGDYISDALAALVGGLGFAPGANIGDNIAIFEATHGTAPKYTGQDKANPGSLILSGAMMLEHIGLTDAATAVRTAVEKTVKESAVAAQEGPGRQLFVTYDIARQFDGYSAENGAKASEFTNRIIQHL